jgi:spoIIIJ-associated protein
MTGEKSGEFRGKSVEAAVAAGLAALRLNRDEVEVEVVRPGSRGVLGIGAEDAVVRLSAIPRGTSRPAQAPEPAAEPRPQAAPRPERQESRPSQPRTEPKPAPAAAAAPAPASATAAPAAPLAGTPEERATAAAEKGRELLLGMLERMGLDADVEIVEQSEAEVDDDDRALVLNIVGDDLGMLIGRQNETLSAIEFVTRLMVNQQVRTRTSFVVDVNGYRAKRAEALRKLALRMADQVAESGRTVALEPMPPAERRIIHLALRDHPKVGTQSVGEGDRRKVTLVPKK